MTYQLGINIARPSDHCEKNKIQEYYGYYFHQFSERGFSVFRIVFTSRSLNPFHKKGQEDLLKIFKYCKKYNLKLILCLYHFTDFIDFYQREYVSKEYLSYWKDIKHSTIINWLKTIDNNWLSDVIYSIELFNEIDLIPLCLREQIINDLNKLLSVIKKSFSFDCHISLANHLNFSSFKERFNCPIDLHLYSFPYDTLLSNIKFIGIINSSNYIGEYAKYSDYYHSSLSSVIYFFAGIRAGGLLWWKLSPFSRRWEELIQEKKYQIWLSIFWNFFWKLPKLQYDQRKEILIEQTKKEICIDSPFKKIFSRLFSLLINPRILKYELWAIKKFLQKTIHKNKLLDQLSFVDEKENLYILLESYVNFSIKIPDFNKYHLCNLQNLLSGEIITITNRDNISQIKPWCYLLYLFKNEENSDFNENNTL